MPPKSPKKQDQSIDFEGALKRLNEIAEDLESEEISIEKSLAIFEEGISLVRAAGNRLESAEQRVRLLTGSGSEPNPCEPGEDSLE